MEVTMWYRVFALTDIEIQPAQLLEHLDRAGLPVQAHFRGDAEGWFEAELIRDGLSLTLSRFVATEDGFRAEMNTWAAWVELHDNNPHRDYLMQQLIGARQVFATEVPDAEPARTTLAALALELCKHLADQTGGFYQIDQQGFFAADSSLLIPE